MTELELTRTPNDRRLYALDGVGTVRLEGLFSHSATAEAGTQTWKFTRRGVWQRQLEATDASGAVVGEISPREIRRGGAFRWGARNLTLRPISPFFERYALSDGDRDVVLLDGKGWGRRPVKLTVPGSEAIDPGLLLFAAFVVHRLAADNDGAAAGSTAAVSGGGGA